MEHPAGARPRLGALLHVQAQQLDARLVRLLPIATRHQVFVDSGLQIVSQLGQDLVGQAARQVVVVLGERDFDLGQLHTRVVLALQGHLDLQFGFIGRQVGDTHRGGIQGLFD